MNDKERIKELEASLKWAAQKLTDCSVERANLEAEVKTLREDALRYRWMRSAGWWDSPIVVLGYGDYEVAQSDELDAAIDAAREGK